MAVVGEAPILRDQVHGQHANALTVLPGTFENHGYGFGIKPGNHDFREAFDRALLEATLTPAYEAVFTRYLGTSE